MAKVRRAAYCSWQHGAAAAPSPALDTWRAAEPLLIDAWQALGSALVDNLRGSRYLQCYTPPATAGDAPPEGKTRQDSGSAGLAACHEGVFCCTRRAEINPGRQTHAAGGRRPAGGQAGRQADVHVGRRTRGEQVLAQVGCSFPHETALPEPTPRGRMLPTVAHAGVQTCAAEPRDEASMQREGVAA